MACEAIMSQSVLRLYQHVFTKKNKNLSPSLLLPSVANPFHRASNNSSFRSLVICSVTAPARICVVFVRPHQYLLAILECENMFLNSSEAWTAALKGRLCSTRKPEENSSAFTTFWSKFSVTHLAPKLVVSTHSIYIKQNLHLSRISEWIWFYYTTDHWISHNIFYSLTKAKP